MMNRPNLPPKLGYVEREVSNGTRYYAPTPETSERIALIEAEQAVQDTNDSMLIDLEYRLTLLELGITE